MSPDLTRLRMVAALLFLGTPPYLFCSFQHVCGAGHMQHGPYPLHQWLSDFWWMACFAITSAIAFRMPARGRLLFLLGGVLLVLSRLLQGDDAIIALPLLGSMGVYALGYLVQPSRFIRPAPAPLKPHA